MNPVKTHRTNTILKAEGCEDLPAEMLPNCFITTWQITPEEMVELIKTRVIHVTIYGNQHPPILLSIESIDHKAN